MKNNEASPPAGPSAWKMERDSDGIVWLTADKPDTSTNVLSSGVLRELNALLDRIALPPPRGVVVLSAKKSGFVAGADIKEFTGITSPESGYRLIHAGQQVFDRLEALRLPHRRRDSRLRARRRPRARPRLPLPRRGE